MYQVQKYICIKRKYSIIFIGYELRESMSESIDIYKVFFFVIALFYNISD